MLYYTLVGEDNYTLMLKYVIIIIIIINPWPESASELYRQRDHRMSAKSVPAFVDTECHVVSVTDPYGRILGWSHYFFFQVAPQLYLRG
jgi:hypothetical protein